MGISDSKIITASAEQGSAEAVTRMKVFIETNLREPITARMVAEAAGYSQYHAARLFREHTGVSPFEYIRRRRLTLSARALRDGGTRVADVAFDHMFGSHEGFTRAFSRTFGISPKRFASHSSPGWMIPLPPLPVKKRKEISDMETKTAVIFTQIVERPARKLLLCRSKKAGDYFAYCEEFGCGTSEKSAPWDILCEIKDALYEPVGAWLPDNMRPAGTGVYAHAVEVPADWAGVLPPGFDLIDLPPCKMIVFQGEPFEDEDYGTAIGDLWKHIKKFNPEVYGYQYAPELAPKMQLAPTGWRGYIELHPVRAL